MSDYRDNIYWFWHEGHQYQVGYCWYSGEWSAIRNDSGVAV